MPPHPTHVIAYETPDPPERPGRVVGSAGESRPGLGSCLIGAIALAVEGIALAAWHLSAGVALFVILLFNYSILVVYLMLLPATVIGIVRAATALRLRIEVRLALVGLGLNAAALAGWVWPIRRWMG